MRERTGGKRRPGGGGDGPGPSVQRLLPLIGVAVLVLVLGYFVLSSCGGSSGTAERTYVKDVNTLLTSSKESGRQLDSAFYNADLQPPAIIQAIRSAGAGAHRNVATAAALKPPGKLKPFQPALVQAMQFREQAASDLAAALEVALKATNSPLPKVLRDGVAKAYGTVIASDAILTQSFTTPAQKVLREAKVTNAQINTDSLWGLTPLLASPDDSGDLILAMKGEAACTGSKGTSIEGVTVAGKPLSTSQTNAVTAHFGKLIFKVTVKNSGDCLLRRVRATVTIRGVADTREMLIPRLAAGQIKELVIPVIGISDLAGTATVQVTVDKQPGEVTVSNNSFSYKIASKL